MSIPRIVYSLRKPVTVGSGPCRQRSRLQRLLINNAKRNHLRRSLMRSSWAGKPPPSKQLQIIEKRYLLLKYHRTCELNLGIKHSAGSSKRPQRGPSEATSTWIGPQGPVRGLPSPNGCQFCLPQQGSRRKKKGRNCPARSAGAGGGNPSPSCLPAVHQSTSGIAIANRPADGQRSGLDGRREVVASTGAMWVRPRTLAGPRAESGFAAKTLSPSVPQKASTR
ncbi:hypothetical protein CKAH01_06005 [Colletotrichum kahawae]|uniref:Uncharacterized protein n=1 Tax=Colletotrichum kahawae TaxID=34407 RepID=A0AAE0D4M3_COLKA|nr:hypothetical protein CKAH01_06005 [Colletotrichum kahawae]